LLADRLWWRMRILRSEGRNANKFKEKTQKKNNSKTQQWMTSRTAMHQIHNYSNPAKYPVVFADTAKICQGLVNVYPNWWAKFTVICKQCSSFHSLENNLTKKVSEWVWFNVPSDTVHVISGLPFQSECTQAHNNRTVSFITKQRRHKSIAIADPVVGQKCMNLIWIWIRPNWNILDPVHHYSRMERKDLKACPSIQSRIISSAKEFQSIVHIYTLNV